MEAMVSIHLFSPNELASWDGTSLKGVVIRENEILVKSYKVKVQEP